MKKVLSKICLPLTLAASLVLAGCGSSGGAGSTPFTLTEDSGVVGYFTFDEDIEANEVVDHSPAAMNVYTGSLDDSVTVEGKNGNGLLFNGDDEYITLESTMLEGDGFTIAMWVNPTEWKDWARVFDIGDTKEDAWCGMDFESKMLRFDVFGAKGAIKVLAPLPQVGKWTHIAATLGGGNAALYVNGKLSQKLPCAVTPADILANVQGIYVGRSNWADPLFNGVMDDVLVADRVFSASEIARLAAGIVVAE